MYIYRERERVIRDKDIDIASREEAEEALEKGLAVVEKVLHRSIYIYVYIYIDR